MIKNILVVVSTPFPEREEEYNRWYTEQHLPDVLRVPGFTSAQRFKIAANGPEGLPGSYLAIYEYETANPSDDLEGAFTVLKNASQSGEMFISTAMDASKIRASICAPITDKILSAP